MLSKMRVIWGHFLSATSRRYGVANLLREAFEPQLAETAGSHWRVFGASVFCRCLPRARCPAMRPKSLLLR